MLRITTVCLLLILNATLTHAQDIRGRDALKLCTEAFNEVWLRRNGYLYSLLITSVGAGAVAMADAQAPPADPRATTTTFVARAAAVKAKVDVSHVRPEEKKNEIAWRGGVAFSLSRFSMYDNDRRRWAEGQTLVAYCDATQQRGAWYVKLDSLELPIGWATASRPDLKAIPR